MAMLAIILLLEHVSCGYYVFCEERQGSRVWEKVGNNSTGRAFVDITQALTQYLCIPSLETCYTQSRVNWHVF